ncbi:MAG: GNAT family N-acetyltransferase [Cytophagales bacterium]
MKTKIIVDDFFMKVEIIPRKKIKNSFWHDLVLKHEMPVYLDWFYLDCVTDWEVLSINDFESFTPIPFRKRFLKNYIQPNYVHAFSWFGKNRTESIDEYLELQNRSINLFWKSVPESGNRKYQSIEKGAFPQNYPDRSLRKNINFSLKSGLTLEKDLDVDVFISLYAKWMKKKIGFISYKPITILKNLINTCRRENSGMIYAARNHNGKIVCADFFAYNEHSLFLPACVTLPESKETRAHLFTVHNIIEDLGKSNQRAIHFGGSNQANFASFNYNFGAKDYFYKLIQKKNHLRFF